MTLIRDVTRKQMKEDIPEFRIGDTLDVHIRVAEDKRERIQVFTGVLIGRRGSGISESLTLRRVSSGLGVERVFLLHSPRIAKIEKVREGAVRRAKLYYLREKRGKKARVKERK